MRISIRVWPMLLLTALPAPARDLSLDEALRLARGGNHRLAAAGRAVEAAAADTRTARAELLPSLAAVATHVDYDGDVFYARFVNLAQPGVADPSAPPTDVGDFSSSQVVVLKLSQTLYAGGALRSRLRGRRIERQIAAEELQWERLDVDYEVTRAYYDALLAQRAMEVAREGVERAREALETVARRRAEEEALKVEALAAESRLAGERHRLAGAEGDLRLARLALARLLALGPGEELRLTTPLAAPLRHLDEEQAVVAARARHPQVAAGELRLALAEELATAAAAHFKPKLELEGYHAWVDSETFFEGNTFGVDLKVSVPFLRDFAAGGAARARSLAASERARSAQQEVRSAVGLRARQAVHALRQAYGAIEVARRALDYQREKQRVTASAFREQLAGTEELMAEQAALADAELGLAAAEHRARLAEAELDRVAPDRVAPDRVAAPVEELRR